jgi:hypothetical protein
MENDHHLIFSKKSATFSFEPDQLSIHFLLKSRFHRFAHHCPDISQSSNELANSQSPFLQSFFFLFIVRVVAIHLNNSAVISHDRPATFNFTRLPCFGRFCCFRWLQNGPYAVPMPLAFRSSAPFGHTPLTAKMASVIFVAP